MYINMYLSILFQNFMAESKAMELDLDNEIEKTKREGILLNTFLYIFT